MAYRSKEIGARIQALRKEHNMTQEELAEILHVSRTHLSNLETGQKNLTLEFLTEVTSYFNVSLDHLVYGINPSSQQIKQAALEISERLQTLAHSL